MGINSSDFNNKVLPDPIKVYGQPESGHKNYADMQRDNPREEIIVKAGKKIIVIDTAGLDAGEVLLYDKTSHKSAAPKELTFSPSVSEKIHEAAKALSRDLNDKQAKDALELTLRNSGALSR